MDTLNVASPWPGLKLWAKIKHTNQQVLSATGMQGEAETHEHIPRLKHPPCLYLLAIHERALRRAGVADVQLTSPVSTRPAKQAGGRGKTHASAISPYLRVPEHVIIRPGVDGDVFADAARHLEPEDGARVPGRGDEAGHG